MQLNIFTNQTNSNRCSTCFNPSNNFTPWREIKRRINSQHVTNLSIKSFIVQDERQFVNVACICCVDDVLLLNVTLIRNLTLQLIANWFIASANNDVWLNSARTELGHAVLRWFCLLFTARTDKWNQSDVHVTDIVTTNFVTELAYCFQKRQDLDVSNGATNFGNDHVDIFGCKTLDSTTNLVCHMWNYLNRASEVITSAFRSKNRLINTAGCCI